MLQQFFKPAAFAMLLIAAASFSSCKSKDDPIAMSVSRLYVSNADTDPAVKNLSVYDPADATASVATEVDTKAKDGNGIFVTSTDKLIQVGRQDKALYIYSGASGIKGTPTSVATITDASLTSGREIAFDEMRGIAYIANNLDSSIRVYENLNTASGATAVTGKKLKLSGEPWALHYDAANDRLLVLIDKAALRVEVYTSPNALAAGVVSASKSITINNTANTSGSRSRLHGLTYSNKLDMLFVTEIGLAAAPAIPDPLFPSFTTDGGIYIIDGASAKLNAGGAIAASRTIYGSNTGLGNPVDIAIDDRDGKGLIYVAEKANKKILAFRTTDNGNIAPTINIATTGSPEAIFLKVQ